MNISATFAVLTLVGLFSAIAFLLRWALLIRAGAGSLDRRICAMATGVVAGGVSARRHVLFCAVVLVTPATAAGQSVWSTPVGQMGPVTSVAFSLDGKLLAAASQDRAVYLLDSATGDLIAKLEGHSESVNSLAFSPDSIHMATGGDDFIRLWDMNSRTPVGRFESDRNSIRSVAFSPDSKLLAAGSFWQSVRLWDVAQRQEVDRLPDSEPLNAVAFSPDGKFLAAGAWDESVRLWDVNSRSEVARLSGHSTRVQALAFAPDSTHLAVASWESSIRLWNVVSQEEVVRLTNSESRNVDALAFSPDRVHLAAGAGDRVWLWDLPTLQWVERLDGHTDDLTSVAFSPDGRFLASGSEDTTVRLWRVLSGPTSVHETAAAMPASFRLSGNFPNPFVSATTIVFDLPSDANVSVQVFDMLGRVVKETDYVRIPAGADRSLNLALPNLSSGAYAVRLTMTSGNETMVDSRTVLLSR